MIPLLLGLALAAPILDAVPAKPDPAARYLLYVHGRIMETKGRQAVSPDFGLYDYDGTLRELAARGFTVIAEIRKGDDPRFPQHLAAQVRGLLAAGVPAEHVTVVGFSRGGGLTVAAAAEIADPNVSYVILAGCGKAESWVAEHAPRVKGRFLSLLEEKDRFEPSCRPLFAAARGLPEAQEVTFHLGLDHGLFYRPRAEWLALVDAFARRAALPIPRGASLASAPSDRR